MTRTFPGTAVCPIFIGRQLNLTALSLLIDGLKSEEGQVVLLSGEAGIGKSRLVAEAKTYAAARSLTWHCSSLPWQTSLQPSRLTLNRRSDGSLPS